MVNCGYCHKLIEHDKPKMFLFNAVHDKCYDVLKEMYEHPEIDMSFDENIIPPMHPLGYNHPEDQPLRKRRRRAKDLIHANELVEAEKFHL